MWKMSSISTRFSLGVENEQAKAGRDGRTFLTRPIIRRERQQGKNNFPCSGDQPRARTGNHTRLIYSVLKVLTIHSHLYIHLTSVVTTTAVFVSFSITPTSHGCPSIILPYRSSMKLTVVVEKFLDQVDVCEHHSTAAISLQP